MVFEPQIFHDSPFMQFYGPTGLEMGNINWPPATSRKVNVVVSLWNVEPKKKRGKKHPTKAPTDNFTANCWFSIIFYHHWDIAKIELFYRSFYLNQVVVDRPFKTCPMLSFCRIKLDSSGKSLARERKQGGNSHLLCEDDKCLPTDFSATGISVCLESSIPLGKSFSFQ